MKPCFSQHERSDFSTRALESEEISRYLTSIIAIFQLNYRDVFFALFRTIRKTHPNTIEYQRVATVVFVRKFLPKITALSALSHPLHPT